MPNSEEQLRAINSFKNLIHYLEEKLDWPLQEYDFDELTFEYQPAELGLKEEDAAKVKNIHQLRPLQSGQPWGIFFVEFENKKLPVVVLRRILSHLVIKKRASANKAREAAWHAEDLMFITTFGEDDLTQREIAFAHFHQSPGDLPTLRVLGWDGGDTPLKLAHVDYQLRQYLAWPDDPSNINNWREQWSKPFRHRIGHVIRTADSLAEVLAALARGIRDKAMKMVTVESSNGPLRQLHKAFQTSLIHDLTEESFADTYAQTITYGLLTAAISRTEGSEGRHGTFIIAENVTDMVPITNPFLREMLQTFLKVGGRKGGIDFDELGIQDVVELLRGEETDLPAILRDFGNKTQGEDPVIHFYEHFLSAYNRQLKIQRGVFYTPQPVVSYIIRSVHELLQTEFGLEDGLASTVTWGEIIAKNPEMKLPVLTLKNPANPESKDVLLSPDTPFVMILDIATGTGTFLVEVIDVVNKTMKAKWQREGKKESEITKLWNDYVPQHLLPRLYGYELMMAPYAIAHMKIGLKLYETGYKFESNKRVRVYLTNTLEPPSDTQQKLEGILPALAHEAEAVNDIKRYIKFTVIVGNPPYAGESSNQGEWISSLIRDYHYVDGKPLGEANPRWLQDDYVKFIRLSQYLINQTKTGLVGLITNHAYLDNATFRGARQSIINVFSREWFLDLHGNLKKKERHPDGSADINVFEIQQGVAISFLLKTMTNKPLSVDHASLFGVREYKYELLNNTSLINTDWHKINPVSPYYLFVPQDQTLFAEYQQFVKITDVMPTHSNGVVTARDNMCISWSSKEAWDTVKKFSALNIEEAREYFQLGKDSRDWQVKLAQADLKNSGPDYKRIVPIYYRPYDIRWTYFTGRSRGYLCMPRGETMSNMLTEKNLALITSRMTKGEIFQHIQVTRSISEAIVMSPKTSNNGFIFPLYVLTDSQHGYTLAFQAERQPNLSQSFLRLLSRLFNLTTGKSFGIPNGLTPEGIFNYLYAILHSPGYRTRYSEFLKIDFPHIPLTTDLEHFNFLAKLGGELVGLHLLEDPIVNKFITKFAGKGDNCIPKRPIWKENAVWINSSQCFDGVPENIWNFHIGGYQVCEKWLKDRKGRTLSDEEIKHYQRIIVVLNETIRIMAKIDRVIDEHGGWPGAFYTGDAATEDNKFIRFSEV